VSSVDFALLYHRGVRDRILGEDVGVDDRTLAYTLEGLTDLNEIVAALVRSAFKDEAPAVGLPAGLSLIAHTAWRRWGNLR
jgi:hypothetical protein